MSRVGMWACARCGLLYQALTYREESDGELLQLCPENALGDFDFTSQEDFASISRVDLQDKQADLPPLSGVGFYENFQNT